MEGGGGSYNQTLSLGSSGCDVCNGLQVCIRKRKQRLFSKKKRENTTFH